MAQGQFGYHKTVELCKNRLIALITQRMQKSSLKGSGANTWQASGMGQTLSQPESMKKGAVDVSRGWCFRVLKHVISKMTYKLRQHLGFFGIIVMSVLAKLRAPSLALQSPHYKPHVQLPRLFPQISDEIPKGEVNCLKSHRKWVADKDAT